MNNYLELKKKNKEVFKKINNTSPRVKELYGEILNL